MPPGVFVDRADRRASSSSSTRWESSSTTLDVVLPRCVRHKNHLDLMIKKIHQIYLPLLRIFLNDSVEGARLALTLTPIARFTVRLDQALDLTGQVSISEPQTLII